MAGQETIHAGELNRIVELFTYNYTRTSTNERVKDNEPTSLGKKRVKRTDVSGTEETDGKIIAISKCIYHMRFELSVLKTGTEYFIRDIDGDFEVHSVSIFGPGRNRFLELKCSHRAED